MKFDVNGVSVSLAEEDLLIELAKSDDYVTEADALVTVVLDIQLTEELLEEGFVREIISKVQTMRKEALGITLCLVILDTSSQHITEDCFLIFLHNSGNLIISGNRKQSHLRRMYRNSVHTVLNRS